MMLVLVYRAHGAYGTQQAYIGTWIAAASVGVIYRVQTASGIYRVHTAHGYTGTASSDIDSIHSS